MEPRALRWTASDRWWRVTGTVLHAPGPELVLSSHLPTNDLGYAGEAAVSSRRPDRLGIAVVR
jgi:hypothetical protein